MHMTARCSSNGQLRQLFNSFPGGLNEESLRSQDALQHCCTLRFDSYRWRCLHTGGSILLFFGHGAAEQAGRKCLLAGARRVKITCAGNNFSWVDWHFCCQPGSLLTSHAIPSCNSPDDHVAWCHAPTMKAGVREAEELTVCVMMLA